MYSIKLEHEFKCRSLLNCTINLIKFYDNLFAMNESFRNIFKIDFQK